MNDKKRISVDEAIGIAVNTGEGRRPVTITKRSLTSGKQNTMQLEVVPDDFMAWRNGKLIQEAMPYLTTQEREFLISGMSIAEQEAFFDAEEA